MRLKSVRGITWLESVILGCGLTAVLAGVGYSRELAETAQIVLIIVAGLAGVLCGVAAWRLQGGRGVPVAGADVAIVAVLSIVLPIVL